MKKLEEMLREKTIKNKLSFVFRIMDVLYVVLALVSVVGYGVEKKRNRNGIENGSINLLIWG